MTQTIKLMYLFIDLVAILLILLLRFDFGAIDKTKRDLNEKIYHLLLLLTAIILVVDAAAWLLDGLAKVRVVVYLFNAVYYICHPLLLSVWSIYVDYQLFENSQRIKRIIPYLCLPIIVVASLSLLSINVPLFFGVSPAGTYYRAAYYPLFVMMNFGYFIYPTYQITRKLQRTNNKSDRQVYRVLLYYPLFPIVGTIFQSFVYGVNAIWILTVISFLIIYFHIQNMHLTTDSLTGLNNRYRFDKYIANLLHEKSTTQKLFLAIIDIEKFKSINDAYGHLEGDRALKIAAKLIIDGIRRRDFLARLGGDEFVVVGQRASEVAIQHTLQNIEKTVDRYNREQGRAYKISLSMGYSFTDNSLKKSKDELMKEADFMMYRHKRQ